MYTVVDFRFTQSCGWVLDVREADTLLPYTANDIEIAEIRNLRQVLDVLPLPSNPSWGDVVDVASENSIEF